MYEVKIMAKLNKIIVDSVEYELETTSFSATSTQPENTQENYDAKRLYLTNNELGFINSTGDSFNYTTLASKDYVDSNLDNAYVEGQNLTISTNTVHTRTGSDPTPDTPDTPADPDTPTGTAYDPRFVIGTREEVAALSEEEVKDKVVIITDELGDNSSSLIDDMQDMLTESLKDVAYKSDIPTIKVNGVALSPNTSNEINIITEPDLETVNLNLYNVDLTANPTTIVLTEVLTTQLKELTTFEEMHCQLTTTDLANQTIKLYYQSTISGDIPQVLFEGHYIANDRYYVCIATMSLDSAATQ
jgi:hypothetical protein